MKILSWNCRGLGSHWTISYLRETWHKYKPEFLFLSETKHDFEFVQRFQDHFGYDSLVTVDPNERSGGLALFYNNEFQVEILYSSKRMIDIEAMVKGKKVFFTFVYGEPVQKLREQVWERLTRFELARSKPWFIIGDLNEITENHEKLLRLCLGIQINLEWRSCEVTVLISAKIGLVFIILIEARAQFFLLLQVRLVSVSFVKEKSGRYEKNVRSKLCWSSREWIVELGYHYTRRSCSSGQMKNKFFKCEY